ncbi:MAG: recombination protein RecR, partial [Faecalibacterium sp.]
MATTAAPLEKLVEEFSKFPGIGRKGATRMAYQVLGMTPSDAQNLALAIQNAHTKLHHCSVCMDYTENDRCAICSAPKRDTSIIC